MEQAAMALGRTNDKLRVHVVCAGFLYGNGEQNDIFYDFFRRAWVSLHPDLAALPLIGQGSNIIPTIHVTDLSSALDLIFTTGQSFSRYLHAVDGASNSTQRGIMQCISEGIGSGAIKECQISEVINEPWCEFLSVDV
jgi:nucleoside-diphosphate-sugar epimerase